MHRAESNLKIKVREEFQDTRDIRVQNRNIKSQLRRYLDNFPFIRLSYVSTLLSNSENPIRIPWDNLIRVLNQFKRFNLHKICQNGDILITVTQLFFLFTPKKRQLHFYVFIASHVSIVFFIRNL